MYLLNGYLFDPKRLLIYSADANTEKISKAYDNKYRPSEPFDLQADPDAMSMDKIAINRVGICLSYNCNLRCRYCGYSSDEQNANKLQLEDIKLFIKDIIVRRTIKKLLSRKDELLEVDFTGGGEPTYEWELFVNSIRFIREECRQNGVPALFRLTTNGMLSDQQIDFIAENFNHVMVSYDGMPDIQNKNRTSPYKHDTNSIVENTIHQLASKGVSLTVRSTIWQKDFDKLLEMYKHVFSLIPSKGIAQWSIYPVLYEGRAATQIKKQENISYAEFFQNYLHFIKYVTSTEGEEKLASIDAPLFHNSACSIFCGAHRLEQPWLMPDKTIITCIESKEGKTIIGEISDGKVQYYKKYQDGLLKIVQRKYIECQECIAYGICKGGCPIWHVRVDNDIQKPLECCLQIEYWKYIINALIAGEYSLGWKLDKIELPGVENREIYKVIKENG